MLFLRKTGLLVLLSVAILVNIISITYIVTLNRQDTESPFPFSDDIRNSLYIEERKGPNVYTAGIPFESKITRYLDVEGCPCPHITKLEVLADMITTREFFLNVLVWAVPVSFCMFLFRRKWMLPRQDKKSPKAL